MRQEKSSLLDDEFAKFLAGRSVLSGSAREEFQGIVSRLSMGLGAGDSCLLLTDAEQELVLASGLVGDGTPVTPLCMTGNLLYLQRIFHYERRLAEQINEMTSGDAPLAYEESLLDLLFEPPQGVTDWQRRAAVQALKKRFLVISGGPGTGKTTVVVSILALLQGGAGGELKIALAAPTGKAAMRLQESVGSAMQRLRERGVSEAGIPEKASTIHRLLGVKQYSPFFRHTAATPLAYDLVVIDEASMVDLALMSKLVDALRPGSRLILLGDRDQLASVESGTVLSDMVQSLPENTVELHHSYRFDGAIREFAAAVNRGDSGAAWSMLTAAEPPNITRLSGDVAHCGGPIYHGYMKAVAAASGVEDYQRLFDRFNAFTILCAVRHGTAGVYGVNAVVEQYLAERGHNCLEEKWYPGRPVMVTRNDYGLELYNGDVGLCLPEPGNPEVLKVWFRRPDGRLQGLLPARLGGCETVYALTIHKSQGAEFGDVLVVLPEKRAALVSRELLYTAVTRARKSVRIKTTREVFDSAVAERVRRSSGLAGLLGADGL